MLLPRNVALVWLDLQKESIRLHRSPDISIKFLLESLSSVSLQQRYINRVQTQKWGTDSFPTQFQSWELGSGVRWLNLSLKRPKWARMRMVYFTNSSTQSTNRSRLPPGISRGGLVSICWGELLVSLRYRRLIRNCERSPPSCEHSKAVHCFERLRSTRYHCDA